MKILWYGHTTQDENWGVYEKTSPGFVRIYRLECGDVKYISKKTIVQLEIGKIYIFPSSESYKIKCNPSVVFKCTWVHVSIIPVSLKNLIVLNGNEEKIYQNLFDTMRTIIDIGKNTDLALEHCIEVFLSYCLEREEFIKIDRSFLNIIDDVLDHIYKTFNVSNFAHDHGYSTEYFIRLFTQKTGVTPYKYYNDCRMVEARKLLREPISIKETGRILCFNDTRTFDRAFRKYYGCTASEYRKKGLMLI